MSVPSPRSATWYSCPSQKPLTTSLARARMGETFTECNAAIGHSCGSSRSSRVYSAPFAAAHWRRRRRIEANNPPWAVAAATISGPSSEAWSTSGASSGSAFGWACSPAGSVAASSPARLKRSSAAPLRSAAPGAAPAARAVPFVSPSSLEAASGRAETGGTDRLVAAAPPDSPWEFACFSNHTATTSKISPMSRATIDPLMSFSLVCLLVQEQKAGSESASQPHSPPDWRVSASYSLAAA